MPRARRLLKTGYLHHVISRGNNKQPLFKSEADFTKYLFFFEQARKKHPVKVYNFCLMDNHVHFLMEPQRDDSIPKLIQQVARNYAWYYNSKHKQVGHIFQGRYKSFLVQKELYFFTCSRYIDLNPVQAGIVDHPAQYQWSGYSTLALGNNGLMHLDMHELYNELGASSQERQAGYRALIFNHNGGNLNLVNRRSVVLGNREFRKQFKSHC